MTGLSRKQLLAASIVLCLMVGGTLATVLRPHSDTPDTSAEIEFAQPLSGGEDTASKTYDVFESQGQDSPPVITVHVTGRIRTPGVYELKPGSRVNDAIEAAGGPLPNSDLENLNLAEKLSDGEQVYVAPVGKTPPPTTSTVRSRHPRTSHQAGYRTPSPKRADDTPEKLSVPGQDSVNLNTASLEDLQRLPGIGPAMAQRIIDYRTEHGSFQSVDQLDEIRGIGPAKLEKIRPFISL